MSLTEMAAAIVEYIQYYLIVGLLIAGLFVVFGLERVEPYSTGSFGFRPLLIPGLCLLWPLVLWRWWAIERRGTDK